MNKNIYETPEANISYKSVEHKRNIFLLVIANLYFWPKLAEYLWFYWSKVQLAMSPPHEIKALLDYSIGIPVYIACVLLIFNVRRGPQLFWKIYVLGAALQELYSFIVEWNQYSMSDNLGDLAILVPLYLMGLVYAYNSASVSDKKSS